MGGLGSIPGLGRSPGEGKGYPLQYSGLENSMGCKESDTTEQLSLTLSAPESFWLFFRVLIALVKYSFSLLILFLRSLYFFYEFCCSSLNFIITVLLKSLC